MTQARQGRGKAMKNLNDLTMLFGSWVWRDRFIQVAANSGHPTCAEAMMWALPRGGGRPSGVPRILTIRLCRDAVRCGHSALDVAASDADNLVWTRRSSHRPAIYTWKRPGRRMIYKVKKRSSTDGAGAAQPAQETAEACLEQPASADADHAGAGARPAPCSEQGGAEDADSRPMLAGDPAGRTGVEKLAPAEWTPSVRLPQPRAQAGRCRGAGRSQRPPVEPEPQYTPSLSAPRGGRSPPSTSTPPEPACAGVQGQLADRAPAPGGAGAGVPGQPGGGDEAGQGGGGHRAAPYGRDCPEACTASSPTISEQVTNQSGGVLAGADRPAQGAASSATTSEQGRNQGGIVTSGRCGSSTPEENSQRGDRGATAVAKQATDQQGGADFPARCAADSPLSARQATDPQGGTECPARCASDLSPAGKRATDQPGAAEGHVRCAAGLPTPASPATDAAGQLAAGLDCPARSASRSPAGAQQAIQQGSGQGAAAVVECAAAADEAGGQYKPGVSPKKEEASIDAYESDCEDSRGEDECISLVASTTSSLVDLHWDGLVAAPLRDAEVGHWSPPDVHYYPEAEWVHVDDIDADFPFASSDAESETIGDESESEDWVLCPAV
mmetsp:Transcript_41079/g.93781  ORF Transcript_41079/g.93781 Transcript_41079/m.93781 type:complete len:613 (-) Transcript_41079:358-2196(-)